MGQKGIYARYIKRLLDIVCSGAFLVLFCWLYALLALLVRIKLGGPMLFRQERPGKNGKIFQMIKFRTMTDARDEEGNLLPDEERLPAFGRWLRSTSLDELPEIWLIFIGKMSIIGPRPLLMEYLPYYTEEEMHRHDVRPGLTGWAQVNGRNAVGWNERFQLDLEYIRSMSFAMDLKIIVLTVKKVLMREGIASSEGSYESNMAEERRTKRENLMRE